MPQVNRRGSGRLINRLGIFRSAGLHVSREYLAAPTSRSALRAAAATLVAFGDSAYPAALASPRRSQIGNLRGEAGGRSQAKQSFGRCRGRGRNGGPCFAHTFSWGGFQVYGLSSEPTRCCRQCHGLRRRGPIVRVALGCLRARPSRALSDFNARYQRVVRAAAVSTGPGRCFGARSTLRGAGP